MDHQKQRDHVGVDALAWDRGVCDVPCAEELRHHRKRDNTTTGMLRIVCMLRIVSAADLQLVSSSRWISNSPMETLPKALGTIQKEKDLIRKGSGRKGRYLCILGESLRLKKGGRVGTLEKLDTKEPVLYIEFPEGRLRLKGTMVFPKNKYLSVRIGTKEAACEDVFESLIVFAKAEWVGKKEDNPDEVVMEIPPSLMVARVDEGLEGETKKDAIREEPGDGFCCDGPNDCEVLKDPMISQSGGKKRRRSIIDLLDDDSDDVIVVDEEGTNAAAVTTTAGADREEDADEEEDPMVTLSQRRSSRSVKQVTYNEDGSDDENDDDE